MSRDSLDTQTGTSLRGRVTEESAQSCLHLTLLWSRHEPERVGEATAVARHASFGRGGDDEPGAPPKLELVRQRPGANEPTGALHAPTLSRRQWVIEPKGDGLLLKSLGRRALLHNGLGCKEALLREGDTVGVEGVLLCLVEQRPRLLPPATESALIGSTDADGIVGESAAVWHLRRELEAAARSDAHCLVLGESGAGKELAARAIHRRGSRPRAPLVSRNAASIPASLVEVELFGNVAGYPNVGTPARQGLVGGADGGTLFLDEVAELTEAQQANLLRVLDSGEYQRLGEDTARRSRFRLVAATNRPLTLLKHDFLARCQERIQVPGLDERRADVPLLMRVIQTRLGASGVQPDAELVDLLVRHRYTHHFRELERLLRLSLRSSPPGTLALTDVVRAELSVPAATGTPTADEVRAALAASTSSADAAKRLGLASRFALYRLMKKLGVEG